MKIFSYAFSRKEVFNQLGYTASTAFEHVMKVFMYPYHESVNHWIQEIYGSLHKVAKLSSSKKYPTSKQILQYTWVGYEDTFQNTMNSLIKDYGYFDKGGADYVYSAVRDYFVWLANELSTYGTVARADIQSKLEELIDKYNLQ